MGCPNTSKFFMVYYRAYGLTLQLNQPIEGVVPVPATTSFDIAVHLLGQADSTGILLDEQVAWVPVVENQRSAISVADQPDGRYTWFHYRGHNEFGVGEWINYLIEPTGHQIWVTWKAPRCDMEAFLLGPVLACALSLRGQTCLHASVVAVEDRCFVLLGAKEAGKSTTAAAFSELGYTVLADDVAVLTQQENHFWVWPGYPQLRLRPDAATTLLGSMDHLTRVFKKDKTAPKRYLDLTQGGKPFPQTPYQLAGIYLLQPRDKFLQVPFITPIAGPASLITLTQHTSMSIVLTKAQRQQEFALLGQLAQQIPVRQVYRPDNLNSLPQVCNLIVEDMLSESDEATFPNTTLADCLPHILPDLPTELASSTALSTVKAVAHHLSPLVSGGFECRLNGQTQLDLQQCIPTNSPQLLLLQAHWANHVKHQASNSPVWERLLAFLTQWREADSTVQKALSELWLEFDSDGLTGEMPLPALFFALPKESSLASDSEVASETILALLLETAFHEALRQQVQCCFTACEHEVFVSHIGVMLSRSTETVRVNVKRLQPHTLTAYLTQIGWTGDTAALVELMESLTPYVDRITVCLDVGRTIGPRIGLECSLLEQSSTETRWAALLDLLVTWGVCLPEKQAALLRWAGRAALSDGGAVVRRLSHIKMDYRPDQPLQAKGYLWFHHEWGHA